jgi:hypothetical protein
MRFRIHRYVAASFFFCADHRVDRVLRFFSNRPNWDSPIPSPAGECAPRLVAGEGGGSQFRRGDRHCSSLDIYVLCGVDVLRGFGAVNLRPPSDGRPLQSLQVINKK